MHRKKLHAHVHVCTHVNRALHGPSTYFDSEHSKKAGKNKYWDQNLFFVYFAGLPTDVNVLLYYGILDAILIIDKTCKTFSAANCGLKIEQKMTLLPKYSKWKWPCCVDETCFVVCGG